MERYMAERTREVLGQNPRLQAIRIADHYISLAIAARDLRDLCILRDQSSDPATIDETIDIVVRGIKTAHLADFGLELEWGRA